MLFSDLSDSEFIKIAESHMEALNHALKNVPEEKVRIHICWGIMKDLTAAILT